MRGTAAGDEVGTLAVVLHSHLPWLPGHGRWPVGEEWLHQAWAQCYLPLVRELRALADEGCTGLLTLGVTPVLAAQLDDAAALRAVGSWVVDWALRAARLADRPEPAVRAVAAHEYRCAATALAELSGPWRAGGSPVLRALSDSGAVELLGGPATHPFLPLLDDDVAGLALRVGLDDARWRRGAAAGGIWSPECGHRPGLERLYADAGVRHAVYDEATFAASSVVSGGAPTVHAGHRMAGTDVVAVARDLAVTDLVWSSRTGYPSGADQRDFHAVDPGSGLRLHAVTGGSGPKRWWDADASAAAVRRDAEHFVAAVRRRLVEVAERRGRSGLVVVAWDTELFGHWWSEGPSFLAAVLRLLPAAGVRTATLEQTLHGDDALLAEDVDLAAGSWGAGKDFSVWSGDAVQDLAADNRAVQERLREVRSALTPTPQRRPLLDALVTQSLLALSSDWAFMVTRDQAPDYARRRATAHRDAVHALADHLLHGAPAPPLPADAPFPWLDARPLLTPPPRHHP